MRIPNFQMERMQSTWENLVEYDMSESGVRPVTLRGLVELGLDLDAALDMPLGYSQSNGTIPLRERLAAIYPGATVDHIEVTNGTSEANYLVALALLQPGDEMAMEVPNYMQLWGVPQSLQAPVRTFRLRPGVRVGAGLGRVRAGGDAAHAAPLPLEPEQPVGRGPLRRRDAAHRRAVRADEHHAAGRRGVPRRRTRRRADAELLGHERPGHRHQRPVEGVRDSGRAHRMDRRAPRRRRDHVEPARLHHDRSEQALRPGGARGRDRREPREALRAHASRPRGQPADHRGVGGRRSAACSSSTGRRPAR